MRQESYTTTHIGEKIREMRLKAGLTQTALAEDFITRNMLSCIENGTALPSLPTLLYIAGKLGVSPAYFLSGEEESSLYRKLAVMPTIRDAYRLGKYEDALRMCREFTTDDAEITEMIFCCLMKLADKARAEHHLVVAADYYRELLGLPDESLYFTDKYRADASFYLDLIMSVLTDDEEITPLFESAPADWAPFLRAEQLLSDGDTDSARCIRLSGLITNTGKKHYLDALLHISNSDYLAAIPCLQMITSSAKPEFYIYHHALKKLEFCYEKMENYRDAYAISKRRAVLDDKFREK